MSESLDDAILQHHQDVFEEKFLLQQLANKDKEYPLGIADVMPVIAAPIRIGGSEIGNILGLGYKSPRRLFYEKTGIIPEFEGNAATHFGNVLEQPILQDWAKRNGYRVVNDFVFKEAQADYPYSDILTIGAQIDGMVEKDGKYWLVEIKTTGNPANSKDYTPPESYVAQACWGLHKVKLSCPEAKTEGSILVCWFHGRGGFVEHVKDIGYSQEWFDAAVIQAEFFAQCCIDNTPPELIGHDDELETLTGLDRQEDEIVDLPEIESMIAEMQRTKALVKEWEKEADRLKAQIIDRMGTAANATAGKYQCSLKEITVAYKAKEASTSIQKRFNVKELK